MVPMCHLRFHQLFDAEAKGASCWVDGHWDETLSHLHLASVVIWIASQARNKKEKRRHVRRKWSYAAGCRRPAGRSEQPKSATGVMAKICMQHNNTALSLSQCVCVWAVLPAKASAGNANRNWKGGGEIALRGTHGSRGLTWRLPLGNVCYNVNFATWDFLFRRDASELCLIKYCSNLGQSIYANWFISNQCWLQGWQWPALIFHSAFN